MGLAYVGSFSHPKYHLPLTSHNLFGSYEQALLVNSSLAALMIGERQQTAIPTTRLQLPMAWLEC